MADTVIQSTHFAQVAASAALKSGFGKCAGIFVSAASVAPTIKLWDSLAGSGLVLVDTFTPVAATFYQIPAIFSNGLFITIGGTVSCTVFFE